MIAGARQGKPNWLRHMLAVSTAHDLRALLVPGPEVAYARGLDLFASGLQLVVTPRHANILLLVGPIPSALADAATVLYAQMMRPRAILALGNHSIPSLSADVVSDFSQQGLLNGVNQLRTVFAQGAYRGSVQDFQAPALEIRIEYTCPMHPEVIQDTPGSCPKCGMTLVLRETQAATGHGSAAHHHSSKTAHDHRTHHHHEGVAPVAQANDGVSEYTCPMHPEVIQDIPGSCPKCGMTLVPRETQAEASPAPAHHHHHSAAGVTHAPSTAGSDSQYTCPMHPEVIQDTPGSCPKCGMTLVPRETQAEASPTPAHHHHHSAAGVTHAPSTAGSDSQYTCPMHPEVIQDTPGSCPKCGMTLVPRETQAEASPTPAHHHHHSAAGVTHAPSTAGSDSQYTCPMHPEVIQDTPGSCPKCGMTLVQAKAGSGEHHHQGHEHMDHDEMAFMSMVEVTKDLPRSPDGLPMDWIEVPFGPVFPGLPGGLLLNLTLDGDTVTKVQAESLVGGANLMSVSGMAATRFVEHLETMDPLAPMAYRLLACRGLEEASGYRPDEAVLRGRIATLEYERIASHLGWLAQLGRQTGLVWLEHHATRLQRVCLQTDFSQISYLSSTLRAFTKRLMHTPLLRARLAGIGTVTADSNLRGPVARAAGLANDARNSDVTYQALSFRRMQRTDGDAFDRLRVHLDEILHSIELIQSAGVLKAPRPFAVGTASGEGQARVETPRGEARLHLVLDNGQVSHAHLDTPSPHHVNLLPELLLQQELGDALTTVCSLDLSPWEFAT